ncbi:MAG: DUF4197 domain-containing protein [Ferruginibacter sp.]
MKKAVFLFICIATFNSTHAQGILSKLGKTTKSDSTKTSGTLLDKINKATSKQGSLLSSEEIISGLKEALTVGTTNSAQILNKTDGFFANAAIKILMPEEAKKAETTLRKFGMGSIVDKAILSMNRAAEDAAGGITDIFWNAIKGMTVTDGLDILRGSDDAATNYLKKNTTSQLTESMRPVIERSMAKTDATKYWKDVFTAYNKFSKEAVNTDISAYVTERSMNGIFYSIAQEELKIRKDPASQVTDLLKKVFGK